jgi:hypothetical protein
MNQTLERWAPVILAAVVLFAAGPAFGQGLINPYGQPQITVGSQPYYYVWVDRTGWHVRWSTPAPVTFAGVIVTNGRFTGVCPAGRFAPSGLSFLSANRANFSIAARPGIGGFDFQTTGPLVTFNFGVNGFPVPGRTLPWLIYIGQNLVPSARLFTLSATPAFAQQACRESPISDVDRPVKDPNR